MTGTRLLDERAQAVRSLGSLLNYVWLDPRKGAHGWNRNAKEEINLQKDVQVSVQALEQLGSQLKTVDEGDKNSEWFKEDHEGTSSLTQGGAERSGVLRDHDRDLQAQGEPLGSGSFHGVSWRDRDRDNDLVNHIGGVFRYFIVDVVDPESTPDVARCGRELSEQFLSHEQE
ncbi:hypothetical protein YC2023_100077 [Brassica napus]